MSREEACPSATFRDQFPLGTIYFPAKCSTASTLSSRLATAHMQLSLCAATQSACSRW